MLRREKSIQRYESRIVNALLIRMCLGEGKGLFDCMQTLGIYHKNRYHEPVLIVLLMTHDHLHTISLTYCKVPSDCCPPGTGWWEPPGDCRRGLSLGYEVCWACMLGAVSEQRWQAGHIVSHFTTELVIIIGSLLLWEDEIYWCKQWDKMTMY